MTLKMNPWPWKSHDLERAKTKWWGLTIMTDLHPWPLTTWPWRLTLRPCSCSMAAVTSYGLDGAVRLRDANWPITSRSVCDGLCLKITQAMTWRHVLEREREMFYLTTHWTDFIYGYMASDIWLRTILIVRKETRCRHIGYSYRLTARVLLYAPSHRQDSTYHGLCYTSHGALAGTRNSLMGPPREGSIWQPIAPWANALTTELHLAPTMTWRHILN